MFSFRNNEDVSHLQTVILTGKRIKMISPILQVRHESVTKLKYLKWYMYLLHYNSNFDSHLKSLKLFQNWKQNSHRKKISAKIKHWSIYAGCYKSSTLSSLTFLIFKTSKQYTLWFCGYLHSIFNYYVPHVLLTPPAPTKSTQQDKSAALFLFTNIPLFPGKVQRNIPRRCWELSIWIKMRRKRGGLKRMKNESISY